MRPKPLAQFPKPVIAWHPTPDYVMGLEGTDSSEVKISPPSGWAICDGTLGTPDLRGLFIRGATEWTPTVTMGGAESHAHGGRTQENDNPRQHHGGAGVKGPHAHSPHAHGINLERHLPPYAELVYIMKLSDLP